MGFIVGGAFKSTFQSTLIILIGVLSGFIDLAAMLQGSPSTNLGVYPYYWLAPFPLSILTTIMSIFPLYLLIFFGSMIYACIGLSIASRTDMTNAMLWNQLIQMPLVFISGAIIPLETLGPASIIGLCNPTTYFADAVRVWLGGQTGNMGTNMIFFGPLATSGPLGYNISLLLGLCVDLLILGIFGSVMFLACFRIFGGGLTESSGGFTAMFHKKTAEAQEKMYKDLGPEERKAMEVLQQKLDGATMMRTFMLQSEGKMDEVFKIYRQHGITEEEINNIMKAGQSIMEKRMKEIQKKKKKKTN